ncbi:phospholipase D-like domain-containing protein [Paraliobacillus salinarum]|uniref:phospholipase D-like domain-containing protein n=1 Tax=Paraliobacillus salinarum TaxID=1158996 RepID=UPI0015F3A6DE|nr:phospholipase D-like domain-containing protein [Paraliobacillus salinarum]
MFIWIIALLLLIILLIWIDFGLGKKFFNNKAPIFSHEYNLDEMDLITEGEQFFDLFFNDLKRAKKTIDICFFIVGNDAISQEFFRILQMKSQSGVQVNLLMDWLGALKVKRKFIQKLERSGVKVKKANKPTFPFLLYRLNRRNHRKIAVIDQQVTYLGGFNVGKEYLGADPKLGHWKDYHIRLTDATSATVLEDIFSYDWKENGTLDSDKTLIDKDFNSALTITEAGQLEINIIEWINKANDSIIIGSPYFIPTKRVFSSLMTALGRGVKLTVLVPEKADHLFVKGAALPFFKKIIKHGASVYYYDHGFYHTKVIFIDHAWCDIGTANFDQRSFLYNQEINLIITNKKLIEPINKAFSDDLANSYLLTEQAIKRMPISAKIASVFSRLIRPFL